MLQSVSRSPSSKRVPDNKPTAWGSYSEGRCLDKPRSLSCDSQVPHLTFKLLIRNLLIHAYTPPTRTTVYPLWPSSTPTCLLFIISTLVLQFPSQQDINSLSSSHILIHCNTHSYPIHKILHTTTLQAKQTSNFLLSSICAVSLSLASSFTPLTFYVTILKTPPSNSPGLRISLNNHREHVMQFIQPGFDINFWLQLYLATSGAGVWQDGTEWYKIIVCYEILWAL